MSGGSYDYAFYRVDDMADAMESRPMTPIRKAFITHLRKVAGAMKAVEWADSSDTSQESADEAMRALLHPSCELNAAYELALEAYDNLSTAIRKAEEMGAE
jgi:hypothetical protein